MSTEDFCEECQNTEEECTCDFFTSCITCDSFGIPIVDDFAPELCPKCEKENETK